MDTNTDVKKLKLMWVLDQIFHSQKTHYPLWIGKEKDKSLLRGHSQLNVLPVQENNLIRAKGNIEYLGDTIEKEISRQ